MLKKNLLSDIRTVHKYIALVVALVVAAIGIYAITGSHAVSPGNVTVSITADQGTQANGAATCPTVGASDDNSVVFTSPVSMDGTVALGLSCPGTPFSPTSFWNTPVPSGVSLNPNSTQYVNGIENQLCYGTFSTAALSSPPDCTKSDVMALNSSNWSAPLYVVPSTQPNVPVENVCLGGVSDQNMGDSNWTSTGWTTTTTSATHTPGNTDYLTTDQASQATNSQYQITYTFSGSPVTGSTVDVTMGGVTVGSYTFNSAVPSEDNFTDTRTITTSSNTSINFGPNGTSGYSPITFTPSSNFNGTISAIYIYSYSAAFNNVVSGGVPIPSDAHGSGESGAALTPDGDTDREIQIYQPSADSGAGEEWEFHEFGKDPNTGNFEACQGGQIDNLPTSSGVFTPNGSGSGGQGVTASGLSLLGGIPRIDEMRTGQIDHVMGLALIYNLEHGTLPANISGATQSYSWPANRTDGGEPNSLAIPEGQRFILDPSLNLSGLGLTPYGMVIAVAAQKYGFVVDDTGANPALRIGDPTTYTVAGLPNPYTSGPGVGGGGTSGLFEGTAQGQVMKNFPWQDLEALPYNYGE